MLQRPTLAFTLRHARNLPAWAAALCAAPLALLALPAGAETTGLERVEISGRVYEAPARYDVREGCSRIDDQLQGALQATWLRERRMGQVHVQMVLDDGQVTAVSARGVSVPVARSVRHAVQTLHCGTQAGVSGPQIYRFRVDFIDPYDEAGSRSAVAAAPAGYRLALLKD